MPILVCFVLFVNTAFGQEHNISIGSWRVHLPCYNMNCIAVGQNQVYAASGSSVLHLDRDDNALMVESKNTGLNDVLVSKVGFNASLNTFILGYETGNMDLIQGNSKVNVNDLFRNSIAGSKKINHFLSDNDLVYVSGDYGVILYNLSKREVVESYLTLTPNSSSNAVYAAALTTDKDSVFLATSKGVMAARIAPSVNLLDFASWYTFTIVDSIEVLNVVSVAANSGYVYAAVNGKGVYYYNGSKWRKTTIPVGGSGIINSLTTSGNSVLACVDSVIYQLKSPKTWSKLFYTPNITPKEAYFDSENNLWIASINGGIVNYKNGVAHYMYPNGPLTNRAFRIGYYNNTIVGLAGGYNSIGQPTYARNWTSVFENNTAWNILQYKYPSIPTTFTDFIGATYNSQSSILYISAYGGGLVAIHDDQSVEIYTNSNSPLIPVSSNVYLGEMAVDKQGNLWVTNRAPSNGMANLHRLGLKGDWKSYAIPGAVSKNVVSITLDDFETKWLRAIAATNESGIVVFNELTGKSRTLSNATGQGALPDIKVNCISKDKKGVIYVGTDKGIAVCYDPDKIFNAGVDLVTPIFEGFPLLYERKVMAIKVDGGNRKWVGTNDGLWLFDEDMTKVLYYFDTDNSPLLSDFIMDIQINDISGEVFFATQEGLISYRGFATEGDEKYTDVVVFPNPVKPDFNGWVGISGLATAAKVKITDVAGNLVYETTAQGGTAVWNVKDYNGKRAATGVYLIFCATAEGTDKFVSKIAVVE